eukprot:gb/GECG01008156.1/.p1 GENE.gb/GECG01008156.1/~~gb/GECG01008156.1/.p1  ORF type:complete len:163 (+),score=23.20 gb/GECG01008156.1/:1-489(+)
MITVITVRVVNINHHGVNPTVTGAPTDRSLDGETSGARIVLLGSTKLTAARAAAGVQMGKPAMMDGAAAATALLANMNTARSLAENAQQENSATRDAILVDNALRVSLQVEVETVTVITALPDVIKTVQEKTTATLHPEVGMQTVAPAQCLVHVEDMDRLLA